jgi:hypothetical protein
MTERVLKVERDFPFLPKPHELRLVLADTPPPAERVTGAFALVFDGDRFLMTRLRDPARAWDIPGGGVEPGEIPEQAMRREVYEEIVWSETADFEVIRRNARAAARVDTQLVEGGHGYTGHEAAAADVIADWLASLG